MRLLESYSRSCSVPINHKPRLYAKYFPLPEIDKYITIQSKSGMPAKDYSYFQEVLDILRPFLDKENIKVIHLGQDSAPLNNTINLNNQTSIGQAYYLLKKSLCHISVDSWMSHAACAENVPCVALYGSTTVANHSPYHFDPAKSIFLESHRNGNKASFAREENPKTVDMILPEEIARAACKLLNIEFTYPFKTVAIGRSYQNKVIESSCNAVVDVKKLGVPNIIVRLDYNFDLNIAAQQASLGKISIVTDKVIPIDFLKQIKPQLVEFIYEIKEDNNPEFCQQLQDLKISYRLFSKLPIEKLNPLKLNYIDFPIINHLINKPPEILKDKILEKLYIKGGKFIIDSKGVFNSYWAYKNSIPIPDFNAGPQDILDVNTQDLWEDFDYLMFLEKI
jgi:hypothetical protein